MDDQTIPPLQPTGSGRWSVNAHLRALSVYRTVGVHDSRAKEREPDTLTPPLVKSTRGPDLFGLFMVGLFLALGVAGWCLGALVRVVGG